VSNGVESEELQRLREQVAALTRRVYHLEQLLGDRPVSGAGQAEVSAVKAEAAVAPPQHAPALLNVVPLPVSETEAPRTEPPSFPQTPAREAPATPTPGNSLESRIGGQWLNRIGIVAVLVGLSYFLKFAFDNNWIGPATQVIIGIVASFALLLWSERFRRKSYIGFAYSLKAVALGGLYLSLWAGSQYYHLVPPSVTFFGMVMVTLIATALSLRQNAELLAGFALVGGFLTPVLVSTGENHELALFSYIALLDLGTVWMVAIKRWPRVLAGSFVGTMLLGAAWAVTYYTEPQLELTLSFATFFFLIYALASFRDSSLSSFANLMIVLAVLNAAMYYLAVHLMLERHYLNELAWLAIAVAAFYFGLAWLLKKRTGGAARLYAPVALALGVGFLTAAIPLGFNTYWITLGWLVEAGALIWAAHRNASLLLRVLGTVVLALGIARLLFLDSDAAEPLLLNARFGLYLVAIAVLGLLAYYSAKDGGANNREWVGAAVVALNVLGLVALNFEVRDYFRPTPGERISSMDWRNVEAVRAFSYSAVWMIYGAGLMLIGFWKRSAFLRWQAIVLLAVTAAKVFLYDISALERGYRIVAFIVLGGILLAVSFFYQRNRAKVTQ
jgi:uncharacterized membrane protein